MEELVLQDRLDLPDPQGKVQQVIPVRQVQQDLLEMSGPPAE